MNKTPLIIAHRGASHLAPENTLAAFELALEQDADGIETDVYMTADQEIVCIHDPSTRRTGAVQHEIVHTNFRDIQDLDVGSWKGEQFRKQHIPRLAEVLDFLPEERLFFLEIKDSLRIIEPLRNLIRQSRFPVERLKLMSFQPDVLAACYQLLPGIETLLLVDYKGMNRYRRPGANKVTARLERIRAAGVNSRALVRFVRPHWVDVLHENGYSVHVWTVNNIKRARFFADCGVDSITTDVPDIIKKELLNKGV